jgi:iron-sulfur cluster repair protein YtfE (RIC family)
MAQKIYVVEGRKFRTEADYQNALKDQQVIENLRVQTKKMSLADQKKLLEVIKHTTNNVTPPPEACTTWKAMYNGINEMIDDLMEHISLENNVLFPRALSGK